MNPTAVIVAGAAYAVFLAILFFPLKTIRKRYGPTLLVANNPST